MPLKYHAVMALPPREFAQTYVERDTILYALGVGAGIPVNGRTEKYFIYEEALRALPTMAAILAAPGFWQRGPEYGIDWRRIVHGEQSIRFHAPLPAAGRVTASMTIDEIYDKGTGRGALLYATRRIFDTATDTLLATVRQGSFLRGDGGCGGPTSGAPAPHEVPADRPADIVLDLATRSEQALIYRLSGDYNPLHVDPDAAIASGFPTPILHGLATYGIVGRALLIALCDNEPRRLRRLDLRFSKPVFPGDTISTEIWRDPAGGKASFIARAIERRVTVITNGYAEYE